MKTRIWMIASAALAAAMLAGCATPPGQADMTLLQRMDQAMRQAAPTLRVSLRLTPEQVNTGGVIGAEVASSVGGYVYLFQLTTDGRATTLVFPNAMDGANFLPAGGVMQLPRPNWRMAARGPAGVGYLMAVVSEKPLDLMQLQTQTPQGQLALSGTYGAAMATLREVAP